MMNKERRNELVDLALDWHDKLRAETEPMTNEERELFLNCLLQGVGKKACDNGKAEEI